MYLDWGSELLGDDFNDRANSVIINFHTEVDVDVEFSQEHWNKNLQYTETKLSNDDRDLFAIVGDISIRIANKLGVQSVYDSDSNKISFKSNSINDKNVPIACNILSTILTHKQIRSSYNKLRENPENPDFPVFPDVPDFREYISHNPELWELRHNFYNRLNHKLIEICMLDAKNAIINIRFVVSANFYKNSRLPAEIFEDFLIKNDFDLLVAQAKEIKLRIIQPTFQGKSQWYGYFIKELDVDKNFDTSFNVYYFVDPADKGKIISEISKDLDAICKIKKYKYTDYDEVKSKNLKFSIPTDPKEQDTFYPFYQFEKYQKEIRPLMSSGEFKRQGKSTQNNYEENKIFLKKIKDEKLCFNITSLIEGDLDIYLKTRKLDDESYALKRSESLKLQYAYEITKVTDYTYEDKDGKMNPYKKN